MRYLILALCLSFLLEASALDVTFTSPEFLNSYAVGDTVDDQPHTIAAGTTEGLYVAAWVSQRPYSGSGFEGDIYFSRSTDGGLTWSSAEILNGNANTDSYRERGVYLASAPNDEFVCVWRFKDDPRYGSDEDLAFAHSADGGKTWSNPAALNSNAPGDVDSESSPKVFCRSDATCMAVWSVLDGSSTFGGDTDIARAISTDGGRTWGVAQRLNTDYITDTITDLSPVVVGSSPEDDTWVVAWTSSHRFGSDFDIVYSRSVGGSTWSATASVDANAASDSTQDLAPSMSITQDGKVVVAWVSGTSELDIMYARSLDLAATWEATSFLSPTMAADSSNENDPCVFFPTGCLGLAAWATDDPVGGSSAALTVEMATTTDGGATWSAPHRLVVPTGSPTDANLSPLVAGLATPSAVTWVVAWISKATLVGGGSDIDVLVVNGTSTLLCGNGVVDCGEACDPAAPGNASACCSAVTCTLAPATTVCRAAAGDCDMAEYCLNGVCPPDDFVGAGTTCRAVAGACDVAENCTGASATCPPDAVATIGTVCRPASGVCDLIETCNGVSATCPVDALFSNVTVCRPAADACDDAETCTGESAACPPDGYVAGGTVCRPAVGPCDVAEECTGAGIACPVDRVQTAFSVCRPAAGLCDVGEWCDGNTTVCPPDTVRDAGFVCRAAEGVCDVEEACDGGNVTCPPDSVRGAGATCRYSAGVCDVEEACDGGNATCPENRFLDAGVVCRPSGGLCDGEEACTGTSAACPVDVRSPENAPCDDGDNCTAGDTCNAAGVCLPGSSVCVGAAVDGEGDGAVPEEEDEWWRWLIYAAVALCLCFTVVVAALRRRAGEESSDMEEAPRLDGPGYRAVDSPPSMAASPGMMGGAMPPPRSMSGGLAPPRWSSEGSRASLDERSALLSDQSYRTVSMVELSSSVTASLDSTTSSSGGSDVEESTLYAPPPPPPPRRKKPPSSTDSSFSSWGEEYKVVEGKTRSHLSVGGRSYGKSTNGRDEVVSFNPTEVFYQGDEAPSSASKRTPKKKQPRRPTMSLSKKPP